MIMESVVSDSFECALFGRFIYLKMSMKDDSESAGQIRGSDGCF